MNSSKKSVKSPNNSLSFDTPLSSIVRIDEAHKKALTRLGLLTVRDILWYFPARYSHLSEIKLIRDIIPDETVTIYGVISKLKTKKSFKTRVPMAEGTITDTTGSLRIIWFNQAYAAKMIRDGQTVTLTGKVTETKHGLQLTNPEWKESSIMPIDTTDSLFGTGKKTHFGYPVYPETRGITSKWIYHTITKIFASNFLSTIEDYLPESIREKYHLPTLATALIWLHTPQEERHAEAARKRFAFEEIFFIQLKRAQERRDYTSAGSYKMEINETVVRDFTDRFPFVLTKAQNDAIEIITKDMAKDAPMTRLLEGDVGSGKTAVAATAAFATIKNRPMDISGKLQTFGNLQVAYMAPTEILATQHFESFIKYFKHTGINIGLITGSGCRKFPTKVASAREQWTTISRTQLLKWVENGEIPIVIGTHALIQKSIVFKHLALVIVDEQHRFGALQRARLAKKGQEKDIKKQKAPHYLSMTATPIPRTLALTIYGDLDLTLLDMMPAGRKPIITTIVTEKDKKGMYDHMREELKNGRQLYVICPRIEDADETNELALIAKSVTSEAKRLQKEEFPTARIGILHSKMTKEKKEDVMAEFLAHEIDILVATSVVEVGVNVPNATVILIEGAERFGLAQLHQLRGRVIRGTHQAYCYLAPRTYSDKTRERLHAIVTAKNGFELAEHDLMLRGTGELSGSKQWGISDIGMDALKNLKLVDAARTEAKQLIEQDPELRSHPLLRHTLDAKNLQLHFE